MRWVRSGLTVVCFSIDMTTEECASWVRVPYPVTIVVDRYYGCYSGANWLAFPLYTEEIPDEVGGGDIEEMCFWDNYGGPVGKGVTPDEAYEDLVKKMKRIVEDSLGLE